MYRLALVSLLLVGCADTGDEGMIILNNTAVPSESCTLTGDKTQPFNAHGEIFDGSPAGYLLTPLVQSRITAIEDSTDDSQRTIFMTGANVTLEVVASTIQDASGNFRAGPAVTLTGTDGQFSTLFSGSLPPSGTANVGFEIIPPQTLRAITTAVGAGTDRFRAEVRATVQIIGTLNGDDIESSAFQFPVSVCNDCVVNVPSTCEKFTGTARAGNACNPFQDGVIDCCTNADNTLSCPAVATPTM